MFREKMSVQLLRILLQLPAEETPVALTIFQMTSVERRTGKFFKATLAGVGGETGMQLKVLKNVF